jgi:chromosome partition protein MukF
LHALPLKPRHVLASFFERRPALDLSTLDLCFVVTLQLKAHELGLASFREEQLLDAFQHVCQIVAPETEQVTARASHTIRRLREQRLLTRVDGAGVARAGEFALSRLASAIVDFYIEDEVLTQDSLELLARTLLVSLNEALDRARRAKRPQDWQAGVIGPLHITVSDLILGIERRQRGLDVQQEQFQQQISSLLESDWFNAIDRCQSLLDSTATTLRQLGELLLRYTHQFETVLHDILELASNNDVQTAEAVAHRVLGQIDRVAAWGASRQQAWSEYYEYVHRYLRDVVRLDPSRALTQRLREQLNEHAGAQFSLTVADAPAMRVLRSVVPPAPPAPVRRPRAERTPKLAEEPAQNPAEALAAHVRELLAEGAVELSHVTAQVSERLPAEQRFASAGRVAELVAHLAQPRACRERPWVPVREGLVIEEWGFAKASPEP